MKKQGGTSYVFREISWDEIDRLREMFPDDDNMWRRYRTMRLRQLNRHEARVFVIVDRGSIIGEITATFISHALPTEAILGQRAYLQAYRIREDHQGKGLGQQLLQYALQKLASDGYTEFTIGVEDKNERARHIYRKFGFTYEIDRGKGDEFDPTEYALLLKRLPQQHTDGNSRSR